MPKNVYEWPGISCHWTCKRSSSHDNHQMGASGWKQTSWCLWTRLNSPSRWIGWVGNLCWLKKNKIWLWTVVDHFKPGILGWVLGDHSSKTFEPLWAIVATWKCYFYVTDGWSVYPRFIPEGDQIISKTYMTRVEGENTRLRHYLARLHRKTLCYSKSEERLRHSIQLLLRYLKFRDVPVP